MDIDKLEAGRELDALVAERVFGWRMRRGPEYDYDGPCEAHLIAVPPTISDNEFDDGKFWPARGVVQPWFFCEKWSTDIAAAFRVVDEIHNPVGGGPLLTLYKLGIDDWAASFWDEIEGKQHFDERLNVIVGWYEAAERYPMSARANTAPLAICRAALKAMLPDENPVRDAPTTQNGPTLRE